MSQMPAFGGMLPAEQIPASAATVAVPAPKNLSVVVFRINRNGAFRFHVMGGPAMAVYRGNAPSPSAQPAFEGTQQEWGFAYGGGVGWWMTDRFAIEGNLTDITTTSPFDAGDFPNSTALDIPRTHNVHTTIGVRWVF